MPRGGVSQCYNESRPVKRLYFIFKQNLAQILIFFGVYLLTDFEIHGPLWQSLDDEEYIFIVGILLVTLGILIFLKHLFPSKNN